MKSFLRGKTKTNTKQNIDLTKNLFVMLNSFLYVMLPFYLIISSDDVYHYKPIIRYLSIITVQLSLHHTYFIYNSCSVWNNFNYVSWKIILNCRWYIVDQSIIVVLKSAFGVQLPGHFLLWNLGYWISSLWASVSSVLNVSNNDT